MLTVGKTELCPHIMAWHEMAEYGVQLPRAPGPFWLRTRSTDQDVFRKVFIENEYGPWKPPAPDWDVRVVIDAGANIGCATLWFHLTFPKARIIAVEPDPSNFERLRRNCGHLPGVELVQAALWGEDTELDLVFEEEGRSLGSWGTRTVQGASSATTRTRALSMDSLVERFKLQRIDYAKFDVEGAEKAIFESPRRDWIARTRLVVAEFHDRFLPGCTVATEAALSGRVREKYCRGENWFYHLA